MKRLNELFKEIEKRKEEESVLHHYENVVTVVRDVLRLEGVQRIKDAELSKAFDKEVIKSGVLPEKYARVFDEIEAAKKDYDAGKLNAADIQKVQRDSRELIRVLVDHIQRKRGVELERTKIRVKHGSKFGEVLLLGKTAFIIHDIDDENRSITKAEILPNGSMTEIKESSLEEYEKAIAHVEMPEKTFIKEKIFEDLKSIFGKDVEILINY